MSVFNTSRRRIAVTGLRNTGKTVFITAMIDQLKNHNNAAFNLNEGGDISGWEEKISSKHDRFPYEEYRGQMTLNGNWPKKTFNLSRYNCYFKFKKGKFGPKKYNLELRDFPGERFADLMMDGADYGKWSDTLLRIWDTPEYKSIVPAYTGLLDKETLNENELITEYKRMLYELTARCKWLISPSTFLLDEKGKQPKQNRKDKENGNQLKDAASEDFFVGVDANSEFAPLTPEAREQNPGLTGRFQSRYETYKTKIVSPFVKSLRECDKMIFLVDIPAILQIGDPLPAESHEMLSNIIGASKPKNGIIKSIANCLVPHQKRWGNITKVAFVAAKSDLVPCDEHTNLENLLKDLTRSVKNDAMANNMKFAYFHASAVTSVTSKAGSRELTGRPIFNQEHKKVKPNESEEKRFTPKKAVPKKWPPSLPPNEYIFPTVYPIFPSATFVPPKQLNLEKILTFLLK